jgi:hypothetical protein
MLQAGLMMDRPLLISDVIEHAAGKFGETAIVSREPDGSTLAFSGRTASAANESINQDTQ